MAFGGITVADQNCLCLLIDGLREQNNKPPGINLYRRKQGLRLHEHLCHRRPGCVVCIHKNQLFIQFHVPYLCLRFYQLMSRRFQKPVHNCLSHLRCVKRLRIDDIYMIAVKLPQNPIQMPGNGRFLRPGADALHIPGGILPPCLICSNDSHG